MNYKSKGKNSPPPTKTGRGRARIEKNSTKDGTTQDKQPTTRRTANTSTSSRHDTSSLLSENGVAQGPQTWEERGEIDIAYSQYLQAKMLEKIMATNMSRMDKNIENQLCSLNKDLRQELRNVTILKQRLVEINQLMEEQSVLNEIIPQLEKLAGKMEEISPLVDGVTEATYIGTNQVVVKNIQLPSNVEETETLVASLNKLAVETVGEAELSRLKILSELGESAEQLQKSAHQIAVSNENCQKHLLPSCCKQLGLVMYHQSCAEKKN